MGRGVPDRWLEYKPIGKRIKGTRFVAFKVPLKEYLLYDVEYNKRFDPKILLDNVPNLGLIIDLTNTMRYYDPVESFIRNGVNHVKLMVPGHAVPEFQFRERFRGYVDSFMRENKNNDKLIGIHCTHGVNRTGFLICYYMVMSLKMDPKLAIQRFTAARGHPMERENYINFILHSTQTAGSLKLYKTQSRSGSENRHRSRSRSQQRSRSRSRHRSRHPSFSGEKIYEQKRRRSHLIHEDSVENPYCSRKQESKRQKISEEKYHRAREPKIREGYQKYDKYQKNEPEIKQIDKYERYNTYTRRSVSRDRTPISRTSNSKHYDPEPTYHWNPEQDWNSPYESNDKIASGETYRPYSPPYYGPEESYNVYNSYGPSMPYGPPMPYVPLPIPPYGLPVPYAKTAPYRAYDPSRFKWKKPVETETSADNGNTKNGNITIEKEVKLRMHNGESSSASVLDHGGHQQQNHSNLTVKVSDNVNNNQTL